MPPISSWPPDEISYEYKMFINVALYSFWFLYFYEVGLLLGEIIKRL